MKRHLKIGYLLLLILGTLLVCTNALAVEYSPGYRITSEAGGIGYNEVAAVLHLSGNSNIKGIAETGAAYNYLGLKQADGKSFEIGLTKDKFDLEDGRWSVFAHANYEGAFSFYDTEGRWVNFRQDGAVFKGPELTVTDGSTVTISLKVIRKDEAVFEISGYEPLYIKIPGADSQGQKQEFRRVTSLMTDDPQGYFKDTRWSEVKIKKGQEPYTEWRPEPSEEWLSNNMDKNDPAASWLYLSKDNETIQTIDIIMGQSFKEKNPYAFTIHSKSDETMRVQFVGNQMYHEGRYLGFGVSGKPMLSLRYMAERFRFQVAYDPKSGSSLLSKGQYSFRIKPGRNMAEIYWAGEKVKEKELTTKPMLKNNTLYLYSLDISDLLGLITNWNNTTRTWDVLYRDYTYKELGFPTAANDDVLKIKGILFDDGRSTMPMLQITGVTDKVHSYSSSVGLVEYGIDQIHKYEMNSDVRLQEEFNRLQVSLTMGQRIIFAKDIEVTVDIEAKELIANPPYQFTSPNKGYVKITQPQMLISGFIAGFNISFPGELMLFVAKEDQLDQSVQINVPIINGQFNHQLDLQDGEGLYKVAVNSVMAGPHGPVYPEITNFYVEYGNTEQE